MVDNFVLKFAITKSYCFLNFYLFISQLLFYKKNKIIIYILLFVSMWF